MQSDSNPLLKSSRNQLRVLAAGCVATGGVAAFLLPGVAQPPSIVPISGSSKASKPVAVSPLPSMARGGDDFETDITGFGAGNLSAGDSESSNGAFKPVRSPGIKTGIKTLSLAQAQSLAVKINIEFRDVPVSELLAMVAMQGDSNISIGSDVDADLKIPYIRLNNVTPAEAIAEIADCAGLKWQEKGPNKFSVSKRLPEGAKPKKSKVPIYEKGFEQIENNGTEFIVNAKQPSTPFDSLIGLNNASKNNSARAEREIRPIRIRNVRPGIIAWWIDAQHQRKPIEFEQSEKNLANNLDPHMLRSGIDPEVYAKLNNRNPAPAMPFAAAYVPNAYQNPYANPAAAAYLNALQPNYKTNYQFGGFGNNNGNNGNNNNNNNNNNNGNNNNGGGGFGGGILELPDDVDQLVAIDSQNVLLVYGTAEGIAKLQTIIDYLDRPIRQVEIEAQFIDVSVNESRGFGIQFSNRNSRTNTTTTTGTGGTGTGGTGTGGTGTGGTTTTTSSGGSIGTGVPGGNRLVISYGQYQAQLNFLSQKGNSRIINSPRVTTMNNLSANLQSSQVTPILLTSSDSGIGGQVAQSQQAFFLTTSVGLQVTPTINNDDTITVFMTPFVQTQVPTPGLTTGSGTGGGSSIPTVLSQSLTTVANVKDNDVIVLGGLRTRTESVVSSRIPILSRLPVVGRLFRTDNRTDVDRELVIFLTARIQRRTEDVTPFLGP